MIHELLEIGPRVTALPIVHGRGDFAWEVRRLMMQHQFDCVAVPLPSSFQASVESAILRLPVPSVVFQREAIDYSQPWEPDQDSKDENEKDFGNNEPGASFVPIDPCQGVIAAIRTAMGDHIPRRFIDLETSSYRPHARALPDAYALKTLPIEKFAAAVVPHIGPSDDPQWRNRIDFMAWQLKQLSVDFEKILFVPSLLDWPWIRQAFHNRDLKCPENELVEKTRTYQINKDTLYFALGELPFITGLYENARRELENDDNVSIDGVKELLIEGREAYEDDYKSRARKITPKLLSQCLKYIRNLTLIDNCFTPQLGTIVTAAQQVAGDGYALHVLEKSKQYPFTADLELPEVRMSLHQAAFASDEFDETDQDDILNITNRLPGPPVVLSQLELIPRPNEDQQKDWKQKWDPFSQCSWPPEDQLIENFRQTVFDRAQEAMGVDLIHTEKFTTSIKDGIDIRDTVRHWYDGEIYVKVLPPTQGKLDCAVMLFDSPADPRDYPWRTTWFAEHKNESTLAFFATDFTQQPVGPGICLGTYGGALFLYPPVGIPDIWHDPRLDFATTMEERLLGAACLHSQCPHVALLSAAQPGHAWRKLAKKFNKKWVHLPLSRFSDSTIQQLRMVHVLNGKEIRSYASDFIRRS